MTESRDVCKICYNSSSHKPNPTLTPYSKTSFDSASGVQKCLLCHQEWAPIRVYKSYNQRWEKIRPRPRIAPNIDFQMCKNANGKCQKGHECSFAHSSVELASWNRDRQNERRPAPQIPGPYQFQLCKHMLNTGTCPYGQRCTFAHSEEELQGWLRDHATQNVPNGNYMPSAPQVQGYPMGVAAGGGMGGVSTEFRCDICNVNLTSRRQLIDHQSGSKHKQQMLASRSPHPVGNPNPAHYHSGGGGRGGGGGGRIRRRPHLTFPINGYKMCMHVQSGRRCVYGDYCTFAHSREEFDEWNRQLAIANAPKATNILRFQQPMGGSDGGGGVGGANATSGAGGGSGHYDLDDFVDESVVEEKQQDFADLVRSKLASEHKRTSMVSGFEKSREGVSISEITNRDLSLMWSTSSAIEWVFEVAVEVPSVLNSIVLFDTLSLDFEISEVILINYGGQARPLTSYATPKEGVAWQLKQRLAPPEKIRVKVKLVPRSGLLGQLVIFEFESFMMVRGLAVHVLTDQELRLSELSESRKKSRPPKPDLYWEQHFTTIHLDTPFLEESDRLLPNYQLPEQVEKLLERGKYENVENRVTMDNYKRRMHNLLYLEEYERRKCMSRYDLYDVDIVIHDRFTGPDGSMNAAPPGFHFVKLSLGEVLSEGQYDIRPSATGKALLLPLNQQVAHECFIEHVGKDSVILRLTAKSKQACAASQNRCSVRFLPSSRVAMRAMHFAVDNLDLSTIFPKSDGCITTMNPSALKKCLDELKGSELNKAQQDAITSMLDPACKTIPSLVLGPFGCGKTRTLKECIKLLCLHFPETRILICTHTNSAADLYVQGMHEEWTRLNRGKPPLIRILFSMRNPRAVSPVVREYCMMDGGRFVIPPLADLKKSKMIVATLSTARNLLFTGLPRDYFTHIFIDEAAQALEPESIIPLVMASPASKIVLAGDHMQLDPPVYSPLARKYNLHLSLLERLYDHEIYDNGVGQLCKTLLTENHRSHQSILSLPSKLFYKNKLTCKVVFPPGGPQGIPAIRFVGVEGHEEQDENSPSFYNSHEATEVVKQVVQLVRKGLSPSDVCVLSYYNAQIQRIRFLMRQQKLGQVEVHSIENVQGREFRALFLSTVRTCSNEPLSDEDGGFLTNAKLFNTAVTRAKQWLVVVGEPITLCTVGSNRLLWGEYIKNCQQEGSFEYQNAEKFESCLEDKIVVRQLLEKVHGEFYGKLKHQKVISNGKVPHPPTSQEPQAPAAATTNYLQATPQLRTHILRSKVTEAAQSGDEAIVAKVTEDLSKLAVEQQAYLLKDPNLFTAKVQEMEQVLRRAGPTAAVMNTSRMQAPLLSQPAPAVNPASGAAALMSDLPPFLQSMMAALMTYLHWCDGNLRGNAFVAGSQEMRENVLKQKTSIQQQIGLVNEQIQLYRDLVKRMKAYQAQIAAGGMAQTQPIPGSVGGANNPAMRTMVGPVTNAMTGGHFVHQSQPVYSGQQLPPTAHAQMKPQQFHPAMHPALDHRYIQMGGQQQQAPPPQAHAPPNPAHFQPQQQQQLRMQPSQHNPPAPPSTTSFMPQAIPQQQQAGPAHFPQAFPSAHPMTQPPQHFPSALPPISSGPLLFQQQPLPGEGVVPGQSRMMSHAAGAVSVSVPAGAHGSSAFSFGVSANLPNSQEHHFNPQRPAGQPSNQLSVQTGVTGLTGTTKNLSPLDAAINESSNRSSPAVARRPLENSELYVSDDEF